MRDLSEITEEFLTEATRAAGWERSRTEAPYVRGDGEVAVTWQSTDGATLMRDVLDSRSLPEPRASAERAALLGRMNGVCPLCEAAARPLGAGEAFDDVTMQRTAGAFGRPQLIVNDELLAERDAAVRAALDVAQPTSWEDADEIIAGVHADFSKPRTTRAAGPEVGPSSEEFVIAHHAACPAAPACLADLAALDG